MNAAIPEQQLTPPAGHHDTLAYRPDCGQVQSSRDASGVTWFVTMPDGSPYIIASGLPAMSALQAHLFLDAAGLCKLNGVEVPIVSPSQAPAQLTRATVTPTLPATSSGLSPLAIALTVAAIGCLALAARSYTHRQPDPLQSRFLNGGASDAN